MLELSLPEVRIAVRCISLHLLNLDSDTVKNLYQDEVELLDKLLKYERFIMGED